MSHFGSRRLSYSRRGMDAGCSTECDGAPRDH
jgi:hypothetical protein